MYALSRLAHELRSFCRTRRGGVAGLEWLVPSFLERLFA